MAWDPLRKEVVDVDGWAARERLVPEATAFARNVETKSPMLRDNHATRKRVPNAAHP